MLAPVITLLLGLLYLLFPRKVLSFSGLEAVEHAPHAIGEGRSSYAGILIAFGAGCLLLQEPALLQPGLNLMLAAAWLIAGFGVILQGLVDGITNFKVFGKFIIYCLLGAAALSSAEPLAFNFRMPLTAGEYIVSFVALLTFVLGFISLFLPKLALKILKLRAKPDCLHGISETRGLLAGFYVALGAAPILLLDNYIAWLFISIILAGTWALTGIGRFISIIVDRGATLYNFAGVIFEIGVGILLLALLFGVI